MQVTQNIGSLEVEHLPRAMGRSNYTLRRLVRLWANLFFNFSVMPLRLSVLLGFIMSGIGVLGAHLCDPGGHPGNPAGRRPAGRPSWPPSCCWRESS